MMKLKQKVQEAKHSLSLSLMVNNVVYVRFNADRKVQATIEVDSLYDGNDFDANITRTKFNELVEPLFQRCLQPVERALEDAGIGSEGKGTFLVSRGYANSPLEIDEVILIGGSTRIVEIQNMLERFFSGKVDCRRESCSKTHRLAQPLNKRINPDEAVAYGAAIQAANLTLSTEEKANTKLSGGSMVRLCNLM